MAIRIILARHGETDWNSSGRWQGHTDMPLNDNGMRQAELLSRTLGRLSISRIYSSDLKRARSTAEVVAREAGIPHITVDRRLRERNLGTFEGLTSPQIAEILNIPVSSLTIRQIENDGSIEVWGSFTSRIVEAIDEIRQTNSSGTVLVVAHGGVLMAVAMRVLGERYGFRKFTNGEFIELSFGDSWILRFREDFSKEYLLEDRHDEAY